MQSNNGKNSVIYTNKARCRDCNRCVRYCPVKAIKIENGQAQVMPEHCIGCGTCVKECPQHAKIYRNDVEKLKLLLKNYSQIAISIAPSFCSFIPEWEWKRLPSALRMAGFTYISETASGAYQTAVKSAEFINKQDNSNSFLFTACPVFVSYIEKNKPDYVKNLVQVVSPMIAHAKMLREKLPDDTAVVFAGPCIAKKTEAERREFDGLIDCVITFEELLEIFEWKNIDLSKCEESSFDEQPPKPARLFPIVGGLLKTASLDTDMTSKNIVAVSGVEEIDDILSTIENSNETFIVEPLFCKQGCINGPAIPKLKSVFEYRNFLIDYFNKNNGTLSADLLSDEKTKAFYKKEKSISAINFGENEIREVLKQTGKNKPEDELNCGACGYSTCREKASAVLMGIAELQMCVPYMRKLAEEKNEIVVQSSPNGIVVLDEKLNIISMNNSFKKMFSCTDAILNKKISYLIDPDPFEKLSTGMETEIRKVVKYPNYSLICHQICYSIKDENQFIGIFVDITDFQTNKEKLNDLKTETITKAQELIEHQISMAQDMAKFLGESTAKGEMLLNKLIDAINK